MPTPYLFAPRFDHYVIAAIITAFCSLLLAAASRRTRGSDPLIWWAVSMILTAVGLLITTTAGITIADGATATSDMIRNDAAGALVLVGAGMGWSAACAFAGRPRRVVIGIAGAFVWLVAVQVPGIRDAVSIRMALSWAIMALYAGAVLEVMRADGQERLPSRPFFLLLIGACGVHDLVRALMALLGAEQTLQPLLAIITAIEAQVRAVGISFLVLAMTKERAELATSHARDIGEARRRFLAQMSHEVRTPLNGVLGLAQVLLHDRRLGGEQRQQVATLEAAGRHLLAIVNDALDLAQIDAGQLTFTIRPFNPTQALKACVALVQAAAEEKNITLTLQQVGELPTLMSGDTTRLRQVLLNLLWNALKFTPPGGTVTLRVGAGTDWLRCEIIDNGPGIPPEKQALLFHDFARLDPNNADGTGLGLAISARLVERMGGRLTYHSGPGGIGSLFRMQLPWPEFETSDDPMDDAAVSDDLSLWQPPLVAAPIQSTLASPIDAPPAPADEERPDSLHMLVVDDVSSNRMVLRALVSAEGYHVTEARNGEDAVALVARDPFDVVLMDIRMPVLDGLEATRRIRALPDAASGTPIIGVSADVEQDTLRNCLAAGMNAVVPKPVDRQTLVAALRRLDLRRRQTRTPELQNLVDTSGV